MIIAEELKDIRKSATKNISGLPWRDLLDYALLQRSNVMFLIGLIETITGEGKTEKIWEKGGKRNEKD